MAAERTRVESPHDETADGLSPDEWARLADGCRRQDRASFDRLVHVTQHRLRRIISRLVNVRHVDLDELLQETYLRAWRNAGRFRSESSLLTWLARIGVNVALNAQRNYRPTVSLSPRHHARPAPSGLDEQAALAAYEQALERLPGELRATFVLHEAEGMTYRQIADVLACPIGTVMSRLHRARERLMSELRERLAEWMP